MQLVQIRSLHHRESSKARPNPPQDFLLSSATHRYINLVTHERRAWTSTFLIVAVGAPLVPRVFNPPPGPLSCSQTTGPLFPLLLKSEPQIIISEMSDWQLRGDSSEDGVVK